MHRGPPGNSKMRAHLLAVSICLSQLLQCSGDLVHGAPPGAEYPPSFKCHDNSSKVALGRAAVNDDWCDCPDGSDEPGTPACAQGRFYCINAGHEGSFVPSGVVADGVCDCCNGSDEAGAAGEGRCPDTCAQLAREAAARGEAERARHRAGRLIRRGLAAPLPQA